MMHDFSKFFLSIASDICLKIDYKKIEKLIGSLVRLRKLNGRLFILGVGGSAGNASHAVNDFRKLCNIETYAPTDNVSEMTARTNDEGWKTVFKEWLKTSNLNNNDAILIFSVGGGNTKAKVSVNLIKAIDYAIKRKSKIFSIVGKSDGYAYLKSDISLLVPSPEPKLITPYSESFQTLIWHCLVSHPKLQVTKTKW